jgi:acyl-CoA synthetase (AMP-forming)/AMP-acid ligase II
VARREDRILDTSLELGLQPDPSRLTLGRFLDDVAVRNGERIALRFQRAPGQWQELSYSALREKAREVAKGLLAEGVVKGARVAVLMPNHPDWVVAAFAVALTGGVLVPVNTFATPDELDYILRHSDASVLLMRDRLLGHAFLEDLLARHGEIAGGEPGRIRCPALPQLRAVFCTGGGAAGGAVEPAETLLERGRDVSDALLNAVGEEIVPSDDGVLIYTSGTTAHPKGVLHMHRAAVIQSWRFAEDMGLSPDDRVLTAQPFFWTAGIAMSLGASLGAGACLILEESFVPERYLALIESERVTVLHAWPHQEKALAEHEDAGRRDLTSIEKVEFSSPVAALAGIEKDVWGTYGSYGLSETFTLSSSLPASTPAELRSGTSGKPLPGMRIKIVDPEQGGDLEGVGEKGEIAVKGVTFMRGYHKVDPELYLDADGYFHTQDGGSFDGDGYLHWSGRLSNLIKTGGANVSPLEIEKVLEERTELRVAQAVGVPHPVLGEAIVLCVVRRDDAEIDGKALRAFLKERLAVYKRPRVILFFGPDELSYTSNQKIQVGPLRELAMKRLGEDGIEIDGVGYSAAAGSP